MALLSEKERKEYFAYLGLGEYNKDNILKVQKKYLLRKSDWDGEYGANTDNLIRHLKAVKDNCKNFAPEEFRCGCGGRYCSGYPTWMKPIELKSIQSIRTHYGKPMTVTCGVRCTKYNKIVGGITNSEHLKGLAVDYYIQGVTDTITNRKKSVKWIKTLPNHHYTYGNGIYVLTENGKTSTGSKSASGMGNALHTDSREGNVAINQDGKLTCDGVGGEATVKAMQRFFGTTQDGTISGQAKAQKKYYPSLTAVTFGTGGSACIKNLQKWVSVTQDGVLGQNTVKAWQKKIGVTADGIFGTASMKAWQKYLNEHDKATYPKATSKGTKIANQAIAFCGDKSKEKDAYKAAAKSVYGADNDTYCHRFVGTVLKKCGYPKMDYSGKTADAWKKIMAYLKKNFTQVSGTPQAGDIHVTQNSKGAYHIFIELGNGKKAEANSKKKYYPHQAKTSTGAKNWLFRAK